MLASFHHVEPRQERWLENIGWKKMRNGMWKNPRTHRIMSFDRAMLRETIKDLFSNRERNHAKFANGPRNARGRQKGCTTVGNRGARLAA